MGDKGEKVGVWFPKKIDGEKLQEFADWLNNWGDFEVYPTSLDGHYLTNYGKGYKKAISDVFNELELDFKTFDKRTKTGFKKVKIEND